MLRIHIACEGPTDYVVLEAALRGMLREADFILQQVQPETSRYGGDAGPFGAGWKGVRSWCLSMCEEGGSVSQSSALIMADLLIIHVDAETADETEINCGKPCPPARATIMALRQVLLGWINEESSPDHVVLCIPSKNTDSWVLAGIYPTNAWVDKNLECRTKPESRMLNKPEKLVRQRGSRYQKSTPSYQLVAGRITERWGAIKKRCGQAEAFENDVLSWI